MNIFASYECPKKSAEVLDDRRLNKMILESAQMLCSAVTITSKGMIQAPYQNTHVNHPCSVWTRDRIANFLWLRDHMEFLLIEYGRRFDRVHGCDYVFRFLKHNCNTIPSGPSDYASRQPFVNSTPYKDLDVHEAYQRYLCDKWDADYDKLRAPNWTNAPRPEFYR